MQSDNDAFEQKTDETLMLQVKQGNRAAFTQLVNRYKKYLINFCLGYLRDFHLAEEVSQEVFFRVYKSAGRYEVKAKFSSWLFKIAVNLCFDNLRKKRNVYSNMEEDAKVRVAVAALPSAGELLEARELEADIREAIFKLPSDQKETLLLAAYGALPYEEIAEIMNVSTDAVKMRISRAREFIKAELKKSSDL